MKQPRYRLDVERSCSGGYRRLQEATTLHSRLMGKPNDGMADLLIAIEGDINKLDDKQKKSLKKKMDEIDTSWEKVWGDVVSLSKAVSLEIIRAKKK